MKIKMGKKGQSGNGIFAVVGVVMALVVVAIVVVVGFNIMTNVQTSATALDVVGNISRTGAYNATANTLSGMNTISGQIPLIALVAALGIILAVLFAFLGGFIGGKGRY
jgi:predicted RND superfamily exporter protein